MTTQKSLSGQPLDQVWIRLARKGFWGSHTAMSCGGSFRSSWRADFHGAFRFHWHFFSSNIPQCTILLVTRVFFNFTTEREKGRENLFLLHVYMLAVPRFLTLDHQMFYKIFRILCNCLFSKRKSPIFSTFY